MLIKRDDLGDATAGSKTRKLEFIFPEILKGDHDWILSIGTTQSNSCAALTTTAAKVGLRSAHVLIKDHYYKEERPADGNLFFHRLFGSQLFLMSREEYRQVGKDKNAILQNIKEVLIKEHGAINPYVIPLGSSTTSGLFGYIECIHELELQLEELNHSVDEIFFSCGSGGTAAGLAIGKYLCKSHKLKSAQLTAYMSWETTPHHFHDYVNEMLATLGLNEVKSEDIIRFVPAHGLGFAINNENDLQVMRDVARSSGVVLDGTYTSKALASFIDERWAKGKNCLFIHTGGIYSMIGREDV